MIGANRIDKFPVAATVDVVNENMYDCCHCCCYCCLLLLSYVHGWSCYSCFVAAAVAVAVAIIADIVVRLLLKMQLSNVEAIVDECSILMLFDEQLNRDNTIEMNKLPLSLKT